MVKKPKTSGATAAPKGKTGSAKKTGGVSAKSAPPRKSTKKK